MGVGAVHVRSGFSLLELLLVLTLLGVLVVTALPRFLDQETGSDTAYLERVAGDLESGAALFRAQWIAAGRPTPKAELPGFAPLRVGPAGYPFSTDERDSISQAPATGEDCAALFRGLLGATAPTVIAAVRASDVETGAATAELAEPADFTAVVAGSECHFFLTRNGAVGELSMLRYHVDRGRTELKHQVVLPSPG